jgi:hypothetical protein
VIAIAATLEVHALALDQAIRNISCCCLILCGAGFGFVTFTDPDTAARVAADKYVHIGGKQVCP